MKENAETRHKKKEKIEFIKTHFPNIKEIDPVAQPDMYRKIKQKLFDAGFYKTGNIHSLNDQSIFKLIMEAKGGKVFKHKIYRSEGKAK